MYYCYTNDQGRESLILHGDGISAAVPSSHPRFAQLVGYLRGQEEHDAQYVRNLLDAGSTLAARLRRLSERVTFDGTHLRFDGDVIDTSLSRHIIRMLRGSDEGYARWVKFLENLAENPSSLSRLHLFTWLADRDFAITPDGHLLGYKGVRADEHNSSVNCGTAVVDGTCHHGHIPNPVGAIVEMPRRQVTADRDAGCSVGLHVGTYAYASGYGQRLLLVAVNPRDVVSVPRDCQYQKLRCCRYTVLAVHDRPGPVTTTSYGVGDGDLFPAECPDYRYTAHFTPEAWVKGHAIEVDPEGPQEWDCTEYAQRNRDYLDRLEAQGDLLDTSDGAVDNDDVFAADPAAPRWVRDWRGPFTIHVRRESG